MDPTLQQHLEDVARAPWAHDFFALLRRIESLSEDRPRIGTTARPADDAVRLGQEPSLAFAGSTIASVDRDRAVPRIAVNVIGLLGPNGPLPTHLTEFARNRVLHHGDRTLVRFLDLLQHRFIGLYYRAWAQAQPTVSHDRAGADRFATWMNALIGLAIDGPRDRDAVTESQKRHFSGLLARGPRNAEGLVALLRAHFGIPVSLEQFAGHWLSLDARERTRLAAGDDSARLGRGAVLGQRVWDRQHRFRLTLGPLDRATYDTFLPGGNALAVLHDWVRTWTADEYAFDVRLLLASDAVPRAVAGVAGQLGWTAWLGGRRRQAPAGDLVFDPERFSRSAATRRSSVPDNFVPAAQAVPTENASLQPASH